MAESNKTEKATPKKRKDERKKGNAYQSKDVVSVVMLVIGFFLIVKLSGFIAKQLEIFYGSQLDKAAGLHELSTETVMQIMRESMGVYFLSAAPVMIVVGFTLFLASGAQTKFLFSGELLKFKYSRISLIEGMKKMLSLNAVVQMLKSILKVIVIMVVIYTSIKELLIVIPDSLSAGLEENIVFLKDRTLSLVYKICLFFVGVAVLDYVYQKYDYEKKLRMSKQEVKDEFKLTEGDPFIKGKIREKQQKMSMNRMIQQVPSADVIVRNPTHYAVALKYDIDQDPAPIVLAKGQDHMAKKIIEIAENNQILIMENKPLARSLYAQVEVNEYIPAELYQAAAELMAWVYKNKGKEQKKS
ncbi:MAG: flagellar biosynthesis protein FlhB [Eubacteriales bacterium]|nr:flagellar biosynthesis protein FlhB [Eubacteriales bacterium]MDD3289468.1 flagellar biosynthesis protein FlhB [Eubacteriales bacterium]MDD3863228.1 flagellar biosynthesis protein FlhB [Eubacteriales bacterium]MDD4444374.1 flagellar biosynthesis protein FlhB [Eubacteriales bacterium]